MSILPLPLPPHQRQGRAFSLLVLGSLVLANLIAAQRFLRLDLTTDRQFSLDPTSARLASALPDRLTIKLFLSRDLPAPAAALGRAARDLLLEYAAHARGKISVEVVDPGLGAAGQRMAARAKVHPIQLGQRSRTRRSVQLGYLGVSLQYGGRIEALPAIWSTHDLEYRVSAAIKRLRQHGRAVHIGFSAGHGEPSLTHGLSGAARALSDYRLSTVPLGPGAAPIAEHLEILVVVSPRRPFARDAQRALDALLLRGKALLLLLDQTSLEAPAEVSDRGSLLLRATARPTGLEALLAHYGVRLDSRPILDRQTRALPLRVSPERMLLVDNPAVPLVTDFARDNPATRQLNELLLLLPTSVALSDVSARTTLSGAVLARSSPSSWRHEGALVLDPLAPAPMRATRGPFPLAVLRRGSFPRFFGRDANARGGPPAAPAAQAAAPGHGLPTGQLIVWGDGEFVMDHQPHSTAGGLLLLRNLVDLLSGDDELIALRGKQQLRRPLHQLDDPAARLLQHAHGIGLPLLVLLLGVTSWRLRDRRRRRQGAALIASRARWSLSPPAAPQPPRDPTPQPRP